MTFPNVKNDAKASTKAQKSQCFPPPHSPPLIFVSAGPPQTDIFWAPPPLPELFLTLGKVKCHRHLWGAQTDILPNWTSCLANTGLRSHSKQTNWPRTDFTACRTAASALPFAEKKRNRKKKRLEQNKRVGIETGVDLPKKKNSGPKGVDPREGGGPPNWGPEKKGVDPTKGGGEVDPCKEEGTPSPPPSKGRGKQKKKGVGPKGGIEKKKGVDQSKGLLSQRRGGVCRPRESGGGGWTTQRRMVDQRRGGGPREGGEGTRRRGEGVDPEKGGGGVAPEKGGGGDPKGGPREGGRGRVCGPREGGCGPKEGVCGPR